MNVLIPTTASWPIAASCSLDPLQCAMRHAPRSCWLWRPLADLPVPANPPRKHEYGPRHVRLRFLDKQEGSNALRQSPNA